MNLTKMIYLASPYSSKLSDPQLQTIEEYNRYKDITNIAGLLHDKYTYAFILPITMSHNTAFSMKSHSGAFARWAQRDLTYISRCDELWVVKLKGWGESTGVRAEIEFAESLDMPVYFINPNTLRKSRKKWG